MSADVTSHCPTCGSCVADLNITYNLTPMLKAAGWQGWREETTDVTAGQLLVRVILVLHELRDDPEHYRAMNPPNGWGSYDGLLEAFDKFAYQLARCPEARVGASL